MNNLRSRLLFALVAPAAALLGGAASARTLADFGSFHLGGRQVSPPGYPVTGLIQNGMKKKNLVN